MKIIKYYDDLFEANADCQYLKDKGIKAVVLNENTNSVIPLGYSNPSMRPHIAVADSELEIAIELLAQNETSVDGEGRKICPECGSQELKLAFGRGTCSRFTRFFIVLHILFYWTGLGNFHRRFICRDCGHEFRP